MIEHLAGQSIDMHLGENVQRPFVIVGLGGRVHSTPLGFHVPSGAPRLPIRPLSPVHKRATMYIRR